MVRPAFYDPNKVGQRYIPDTRAAVNAGRALDVRPAREDQQRTALLLVDMQIDFVHENGALSVPGAVDDARRTIEWLFDHLGTITTIVASLDSHLPIQVFSPAWWIDADGQHPEPYTVITSDDVAAGKWKPLYEQEWSREYVSTLESQAKKQLMIWPYHTLIGTPGHNLTPALYEAIAYHSSARQAQPVFVEKGKIPRSEHYSLFEPEVKLDELPAGGLNKELLEQLAEYDRIYIAGQAKSHCVLESVSTMMRYYQERPEVIRKLHLLTDCMSSVAHPEIDFEKMATEAFDSYAQQGLQLITTQKTPAS